MTTMDDRRYVDYVYKISSLQPDLNGLQLQPRPSIYRLYSHLQSIASYQLCINNNCQHGTTPTHATLYKRVYKNSSRSVHPMSSKKHLKSCVLCDKIAKPQPNRIKVSKNFKRFANSNDKFQFKKPQQWRMMQFIVFKI